MFLPCDPMTLPGNCWANGTGLAAYCSRALPQAGTITAATLQERRAFAGVDHGGLSAFQAVGDILFSNGGRDPWHAAGGVNNDTTASTHQLPVVAIPSGAHHIDLRVGRWVTACFWALGVGRRQQAAEVALPPPMVCPQPVWLCPPARTACVVRCALFNRLSAKQRTTPPLASLTLVLLTRSLL
jgi:hypothetical protein